MKSNDIDEIRKYDELELLMEVDSVLFKYPKAKVISAYFLLGANVCSLLLFFPLWIVSIKFSDIIVFIFFGVIVGTIPALITGLVVAFSEVVIKNIFSYALIGAIGFFVTSFYFSIFLREVLFFPWFAFIGGLGAIILAFFFVPKENQIFKK